MPFYKHNGEPVKKVKEAATQAVDIKKQIAALELQLKGLTATLMEEMTKHDVKSFEIPELVSITYIAPTTALKFDSTKFKADHEDLYKEYLKESAVKASIRMNIV